MRVEIHLEITLLGLILPIDVLHDVVQICGQTETPGEFGRCTDDRSQVRGRFTIIADSRNGTVQRNMEDSYLKSGASTVTLTQPSDASSTQSTLSNSEMTSG